jgi:hypothetical protein
MFERQVSLPVEVRIRQHFGVVLASGRCHQISSAKNLVRATVDYNQMKLKSKAPAGTRAKVRKSKE